MGSCALRDLGAFVHRTIVEDEHTYAVRIDDGAMLDAAEQIERARPHLTLTAREQLAQILACEPDKLDRELDTLTARAKTKALKLKITPETRDRAPGSDASPTSIDADRTSRTPSGSSTPSL